MIEFDIETEEYALEEEKRKKEWNQSNREYCREMVSFVNGFLSSKSKDEENKFITYFSDEDIIKRMHGDNQLAFAMIVRDILVAERNAGVENAIIYCADTLDDMIKIIRQVKFLLWEIEFLDSTEAMDLLMRFSKNIKLSNKALAHMIVISSYDRTKVIGGLYGR